MINWALEHINIQTISVINHQQTAIDSFRPENLQVMYNLSPTPKYTYNATFLLDFERKECTQYNINGCDIIKTWWGHTDKFRAYAHGMYSTTSLDSHVLYITMMLCRLFGKRNPVHLSVECLRQYRYSNRGRTPSLTTHITRSKINTLMFSHVKTPTRKHPRSQPMRPLGAVY
jgi:hypothetical protein